MDAKALTRAVNDADVVVNALNPPYTEWSKLALPMAQNVVEACRAARGSGGTDQQGNDNAGALHLFPGNVYNFGHDMPEVLCPDTPQNAGTRKGRIRMEMEALFARAAEERRLRTTILRAGDFFGGPVPGSWFDLVIAKKVSRSSFTYPGPTNLPHAWAYLPDLARAFVDLAEQHAEQHAFASLGFKGHTLLGEELRAALEHASGRTLKPSSLPWPVIRLMGLIHPMSREIVEISYLWRTSHRIDGAALHGMIGPLRETPLEEAVREAIGELQQ